MENFERSRPNQNQPLHSRHESLQSITQQPYQCHVPRRVTSCGPSRCARSMTSLNLFFAVWSIQRVIFKPPQEVLLQIARRSSCTVYSTSTDARSQDGRLLVGFLRDVVCRYRLSQPSLNCDPGAPPPAEASSPGELASAGGGATYTLTRSTSTPPPLPHPQGSVTTMLNSAPGVDRT